MGKINIVVLISGRGSNLQAIINGIETGKVDARISCVISNKPDAFGLERAKQHNIPSAVVNSKEFKDKGGYEKELLRVIDDYKPDLICLAGYMRIVGADIIKKYKGKIMNIHPALLPSFPGLHGQKQAIDYGAKVSGCSVHFVDEGCDTGPIILQAAVPVTDDDTEETLSERILAEEHKAYPKAIQLFAKRKLKIEGRKVRIQ
ncbi:MAG: phosphoribosylglycinamide formyltransferase [Candidatus Saganbacteria bacterium]|nr:phosphoribosylglycinamide formyltransferase [Candidatus Saganbacteria bacterium]